MHGDRERNIRAGEVMLQTEMMVYVDYKQLYEEQLAKNAGLETLVATLRKENHNLRLSDARLPNSGYDWLINLQYRNKAMGAQLKDFKSGETYVKMQADHKAALAAKDRDIKKLKLELADAHRQVVDVRKIYETIEADLLKEHAKEVLRLNSVTKALEKKLLETQIMLDAERVKFREKCKELYEVKTALEEEQGKNQKLHAQINRDFENSSLSSSQKPNYKKITNNRERTGKKPGGQPGHEGHSIKPHTPTNIVNIPVPDIYSDIEKFEPTGRVITKQVVDIELNLIVNEYRTPEYRNKSTGQFVHAEFPAGAVNAVNYGGKIKSLAFLLNNRYNVATEKVSELISELTHGELNISTGMINGLAKEFSKKTEAEQKKAYADILLSPVMNVDLTTAKVNGKQMYVLVCATPAGILYFAKEHKGHASVQGTPVFEYFGILVHDHDTTYYKYGTLHQECLEHILRYLKDSMQNEPNLTWNAQMRELIRGMIHFRNGLGLEPKKNPDKLFPEKVKGFERRYDEILELAKREYEYEPPSKYYLEGMNLYERMEKYKSSHLLFLHDWRVPHTNNLSERLLRIFKRKQHQMMTFRSFENLEYFCNVLGPIEMMRGAGKNLYEGAAEIFERPVKKAGRAAS
jgi:hypothetical protein